MAMLYLGFVAERHRVWERRQKGETAPWTADPILASRKFTNVFRVLDPGSQFVLTDLAAEDLERRDLLMRLFLYRHTGRIEAWRYLQVEIGGYPVVDDLDDVREVFKDYRDGKRPFFTSAYLVFPQSSVPGTDKIDSIIDLTKRLFVDQTTWKVFLAAPTPAERFASLRENKGVADFMSMQILTDWGYVRPQDEDEFVVAGPGAVKGAAALGLKAPDAIRWARAAVHAMPDCPAIKTGSGATRLPSTMDIQNTLCEFSKYVRYLGKPVKTEPYRPAHPGSQPTPVLPTHW